ncbi:MAG: 1,6-anhydro-N-acetylmuramyl-L-alanine amidase AmpD [Gammaproteobacteria bacterium]|nr:MAG: 1,6-anhydro-N-acetylmuramyl-L-alanine amidase AmpD [Gammaproteobacteria bacterium]
MRIDPASHLVVGVRYAPSPNYDGRPEGAPLSLVVVHNISLPPNEFGGPYIEQLFTNQLDPNEHPYFEEIKDHKVSAHILIRRNGEVVQFVPFNKRAWHAGESAYKGCENCNDFAIGIELEGADETSYEEVQYSVLATLVDSLRMTYPSLSKEDIVGHSNIAPSRKSDPGMSFQWKKFRDLLA